MDSAADHVLQDARHREVGAGGRVVELVGRDPIDHRLDQGDDLVELLDTVHGFSLFLANRFGGLGGPHPRCVSKTVTAVTPTVTEGAMSEDPGSGLP